MREQTTATGAVERGSTTFTPGPWEAVTTVVRSPMPEGCRIATCDMPTESAAVEHNEQAYANARLIAAAPDLYEALDALLAVVRARHLVAPLDEEGAIDVVALTYADTVMAVGRTALAKARGELVPV